MTRERSCLWFCCVLLALSFLVTGCRRSEDQGPPAREEGAMTMTLISSAFAAGATIPSKHTADGEDVSPPLKWANVPENTESLALICDDPDAPVTRPR